MAVGLAAKQGVELRGAIMYVTLRPCLSCLTLALEAGIRGITYREAWTYPEDLEKPYQLLAASLAFFRSGE